MFYSNLYNEIRNFKLFQYDILNHLNSLINL